MKLKTKIQDEDFEMGEIVTAEFISSDDIVIRTTSAAGGVHIIRYKSLAELNEEWEDE